MTSTINAPSPPAATNQQTFPTAPRRMPESAAEQQKTEAVAQRLPVRARLTPLAEQEAADYLVHQVRTAGGRPEAVWTDEALAYNSLVVEWSDISGAAERLGRRTAEQANLFS